MRIKLQTSVSTLGGRYDAGESYEVPATLGEQWIKNGWATRSVSQSSKARKPRSKKAI